MATINYYEVLGLAVGEGDPELIRLANLSRTREEKSRALGTHSEEALTTLENIGKAYSTLRDPVLKDRYDKSIGLSRTHDTHSRDLKPRRRRLPPPVLQPPPAPVDSQPLIGSLQVFPSESVPKNASKENSPISLPIDEGKNIRWAIGSISAFSLLATVVAFWIPFLAFFSIPMWVVFASWWTVLCCQTPVNKARWVYWTELRLGRKTLQQKYRRLEAIRAPTSNSSPARRQLHKRMIRTRAELARITATKEGELRTYRERDQQTQLENYLRSYMITPDSIKGVGGSRLATLHSYGITTALDINTEISEIPGFGPSLTEATLAYRNDLLTRFEPKPPQKTSAWLEIQSKYDDRMNALETTLASEPQLLRTILDSEKSEAVEVRSEIETIAKEVSASAAKLHWLKNHSWF